MPSDGELLERSQQGDEAAFDALYSRYATRLHSYLLRFTGSRATAEDLLQEVFIRLCREQGLRVPEDRLAPWLYTVARNVAISHGRSLSRRRARDAAAHGTVLHPTPDASREPLALRRLELAGLQAALAELPEPQREVVLLKLTGGLSHAEIAALQGVPVGTVKSRLHGAIGALRRRLNGEQTCSATTARRS